MSEINTIFFDLDGTLYAMHLLHKEAMQRVGVFLKRHIIFPENCYPIVSKKNNKRLKTE